MLVGNNAEIIGSTPLIKIESLSKLTGCEIYAKAEHLNPSGSIKDRTALGIILDAKNKNLLPENGVIVEGTAGNTGIGLASIARVMGYKCIVVMPDNQSQEKYEILRALGAELMLVSPCPFADQKHFYHTAKRVAEENSYFWANQFENLANFQTHYSTTGSEIWQQTSGALDAFICSAGTGGTIAGVSTFLKEKNKNIQVHLADPMGSGLFNYVKAGQIKSEGSSITEGIGIMRLTANFQKAQIDEAVQVNDQEMLDMLYYLAQNEGLLVGTSAALNISATYKYAKQNQKKNLKLVTIICDSALRYQSKVFNQDFLNEKKLNKPDGKSI